jgi:hypothetical protein
MMDINRLSMTIFVMSPHNINKIHAVTGCAISLNGSVSLSARLILNVYTKDIA